MSNPPDRTIRTPKKEAAFLEELSQGNSVAQACRAAEIGRTTAYDWRNADEDFAARWDAAIEEGTDLLEDAAKKRAIDGSDTLMIFLMKGRRPDKYRDNSTVKLQGDPDQPQVLEVRYVNADANAS